MKAKILFCSMLLTACFFSMHVGAQIKVINTGKVGVGLADTIVPLSTLSVGSAGQNNAKLSVYGSGSPLGNQYGIFSHTNMDVYDASIYSIAGKCSGLSLYMTGVYGEAISSSTLIPGGMMKTLTHPTTYGVYGIAGGSARDNYGVYGTIQSAVSIGAGVLGTINGTDGLMSGRYAGYFVGQTRVAGAFTALSISTYTNPFPLRGSTDADGDLPDKILSLRPIQYQLGDTTMDDGLTHYGLDAQVMKRLFPDLVQEDKAGCISINYVELIPLLVQTVQELSAELEELKSANRQNAPSYKSGTPDNKQAALFQNTPNPFSQSTKIGYYLPTDTREAAIRVYDMNGGELAVYSLTSFGTGELTIDGGTFRAGMYLYALIADGQLIDTKQMILTK